jgi:cytoskeletal protein RodZ
MKYDEEYCKICEQLGNHIKSIRESKGISLKEVSTNTGIR